MESDKLSDEKQRAEDPSIWSTEEALKNLLVRKAAWLANRKAYYPNSQYVASLVAVRKEIDSIAVSIPKAPESLLFPLPKPSFSKKKKPNGRIPSPPCASPPSVLPTSSPISISPLFSMPASPAFSTMDLLSAPSSPTFPSSPTSKKPKMTAGLLKNKKKIDRN
eukprot:Phypoly_transcript_17445.p1 GENE.Phypoly_transcript_17445~~Phypoly_transcript_17445.p1  ORF type:complete len:164 (+),score=39.37 Phypoly_transcript_17445:227-718(+)